MSVAIKNKIVKLVTFFSIFRLFGAWYHEESSPVTTTMQHYLHHL